jgi:hypothetical protein
VVVTDRNVVTTFLNPPAIAEISILVNDDGTLNGGVAGHDLLVYRDNDFSGTFTGGDTTLITGEVTFFSSAGVTVEFKFDTTGGDWASDFSYLLNPNGSVAPVGIQLDLLGPPDPTQNIDFSVPFSGYQPKGILGAVIPPNVTGTIGFWRNKNGQDQLRLLGATKAAQKGASTALGNWMATNFPNLYGSKAGLNSFAGKTTTYIVNRFDTIFKSVSPKTECQVMGVAFAMFVTTLELNTSTLARDFAIKHGFQLSSQSSPMNLRNILWAVGGNGEAFAVKNSLNKYVSADNQSLSVWTLLKRTDSFASKGALYPSSLVISGVTYTSATLKGQANNVYSAINEFHDI